MAREIFAATYGFFKDVDGSFLRKNQKILAGLRVKKAFLGERPESRPGVLGGDDVLLRVTEFILWGNGHSRPYRIQKDSDTVSPQRPEDAAKAVVAIIKACEEYAYVRRTVGYSPGPSPGDVENDRSALEIFKYIKDNQPEVWMDFSRRVRYLPEFGSSFATEWNDEPWPLPDPRLWFHVPEVPVEKSPLLEVSEKFCAVERSPSAEQLYSRLE